MSDPMSATFFGIELGAYVTDERAGEYEGGTINVGEVPRCRSWTEAEALGRLLIGRTAVDCLRGVAGFEPAYGCERNEDVVTSFSVYHYVNGETVECVDYDRNGRRCW